MRLNVWGSESSNGGMQETYTTCRTMFNILLNLANRGPAWNDRGMAANDRLTGLDASFLHLEASGNAHMHVAGVYVFEGPPPGYDEFVEQLAQRLDLVPRYRQRLAFVPFG